jgi:tetraacyldisaccharide 4'-kinase
MKAATALLFPFAVLYDAVTSVRNRLYDLSLRPSASFEIPVVSVGNLAVGGTGKTPMVEHLIRLLSNSYSVATLSRGYKRTTKGFRIANDTDSAETLGDEPFQFYSKFKAKTVVTVGEERALAISNILQEFPETSVILLDDAFQHRRVKPAFQILLTVYDNLFFNDWLLPAGRLRESKTGARRADVVVVTKCPHTLLEEEMISIEKRIHHYTSKPVFFTTIHYGEPTAVGSNSPRPEKNIVLVTGLANADHLKFFLSQNHTIVRHFEFEDHHHYTEADVKRMVNVAREKGAQIVTTEKDATKLRAAQCSQHFGDMSWFYIPIEIGFLKSGRDFDEMVLNAVANA